MNNDETYIKHIAEAIEKIEGYMVGLTFEQFSKDTKTVDAVIRNFEIIGEAANNISQEFQNTHSEIPWNRIISMRNRLIHEYFGVNEEIVWDTCKEKLPVLKKQMEEVLRENLIS
jgi:uncharacterized protein with HEPN domain